MYSIIYLPIQLYPLADRHSYLANLFLSSPLYHLLILCLSVHQEDLGGEIAGACDFHPKRARTDAAEEATIARAGPQTLQEANQWPDNYRNRLPGFVVNEIAKLFMKGVGMGTHWSGMDSAAVAGSFLSLAFKDKDREQAGLPDDPPGGLDVYHAADLSPKCSGPEESQRPIKGSPCVWRR